jgi:23S rRNA (uracil1939-C5)-methyltransferase
VGSSRENLADDAPASTWLIEKLVPGGDGMARLADGRISFVSGGLPGDVVAPTTVSAKKSYVRAEAWSLERPSSLRVVPPCPIAARCGGCDWMALERSAQLEQKGAILREALERTAKFTKLPSSLSVVTAGPDLGYRARVRFHIDEAGAIGFFSRRSHALVEVPECAVCRPEINRALSALRGIDRGILRSFSEIEIRSGLDAGAGVALRFELRRGFAVSAKTRAALAELPHVVVTIAGEPGPARGGDQRLTLRGGVSVRAPSGAFTQVNPEINALLVAAIVDGARARGVARFCDLYAGVGNFALPLLAAGMTGVAVERDARAVRSAERAARENGLNGTFVADDAEHYLRRLHAARPSLEHRPRSARRRETAGAIFPPSEAEFDLVVLDPPRRGAKEALEHIVRLAPEHVAMCSCDPVTFARDLATLAHAGYELGDLSAYDMFPHTHHLEALAWMERKTNRPSP